MQTPHPTSRLRNLVVALLSCCLALPPTLMFAPSVSAQEQGRAAVSSNGVSIGFQNDGGKATSSNGVSISFQNAASPNGGGNATSNGVSIGFQDFGGTPPAITNLSPLLLGFFFWLPRV